MSLSEVPPGGTHGCQCTRLIINCRYLTLISKRMDCNIITARMSGTSLVSYSFVPLSVKKHSSCASPCPAVQQQRLLSSPRLGAPNANAPTRLLIRRSVPFTDAGIVVLYQGLVLPGPGLHGLLELGQEVVMQGKAHLTNEIGTPDPS